MDIDWGISTWTLAVTGATLAVALIGVLVGLSLLSSTRRQAKSIRADLERRAKFELSCRMTMPSGAAATREQRNGAGGYLFTFQDEGTEPIEVRLVIQLRNIGDRAARNVLWNVVGPTGIDLQFTDVSRRIEQVAQACGTVATWTGEQVDASCGTRLWDLVLRSHPYELAVRFVCPRDVLRRGVPIRVTVDSDDLHRGRTTAGEGATTWLWVLKSAPDPG